MDKDIKELEKRKNFIENEIVAEVRELVNKIKCSNELFSQPNEVNVYYTLGMLTKDIEKLDEINSNIIRCNYNNEENI